MTKLTGYLHYCIGYYFGINKGAFKQKKWWVVGLRWGCKPNWSPSKYHKPIGIQKMFRQQKSFVHNPWHKFFEWMVAFRKLQNKIQYNKLRWIKENYSEKTLLDQNLVNLFNLYNLFIKWISYERSHLGSTTQPTIVLGEGQSRYFDIPKESPNSFIFMQVLVKICSEIPSDFFSPTSFMNLPIYYLTAPSY